MTNLEAGRAENVSPQQRMPDITTQIGRGKLLYMNPSMATIAEIPTTLGGFGIDSSRIFTAPPRVVETTHDDVVSEKLHSYFKLVRGGRQKYVTERVLLRYLMHGCLRSPTQNNTGMQIEAYTRGPGKDPYGWVFNGPEESIFITEVENSPAVCEVLVRHMCCPRKLNDSGPQDPPVLSRFSFYDLIFPDGQEEPSGAFHIFLDIVDGEMGYRYNMTVSAIGDIPGILDEDPRTFSFTGDYHMS